jgi:Asp-tRNA(Asn)/Glu-tRNA(Gln) amidotransferase A subunit family amidase
MVIPVNFFSLPSCPVPVGCDDGLPQRVQLIGRRFREDLLLDETKAMEARRSSRQSNREAARRCSARKTRIVFNNRNR